MRYNFLHKMSFKRKLLIYTLLFSIAPVVIVGMISSYIITVNISEEVERSHQTTLEQIKFQLDQFGANLQLASIYMASNESVQKSIQLGLSNENVTDTLQMTESIRDQRIFSPIRFDVAVLYSNYNHVYSTKDVIDTYSNSIYYQIMQTIRPKYNESFIVTPKTFHNQEDLLLFRPVPLHSYYTSGILVLHVSIEELMQFTNKLHLGYDSKIFIVDHNGRIVLSQNKAEIGTQLTSLTNLYHYWQNPDGFSGTYTLDAEKYKLSSMKSGLNNWTYIVMTPMKRLSEKPDHIQNITWVIVAILTFLWVLISFISSRHMYFPIERLLHKFPSVSDPNSDKAMDAIKQLDLYLQRMETSNRDLRRQLDEYLPYLKESMYHRLFWGELSEEEIRRKIDKLDLPVQGTWFYICVIMVDEITSFTKTYQGRDRSLIQYSLRKMAEEIFKDKMPCMTLIPQTGQVAVVIGRHRISKESDQEVYELADSCRIHIKQYFHFTVSVSISRGRQHYSSIHTGYMDALSMLNYRLLMGRDVTIADNKVDLAIKRSGKEMIKLQKEIAFHVAQGRLDEANALLDQMIQQVPQYAQNSETVLGLFSQMLGELSHLMHEMGFELNEFFDIDLYKHLYSLNTLYDVKLWFGDVVFPTIKEQIVGLNVSKQQLLIQRVSLYLKENFDKDLSLQRTAEQFAVSPSYLSRVFKEETGQQFSDFIISSRVEKAKEWLENSDISIKEIADRLCYTRVQSFSRIFKQIEGIPPGEYRKMTRGEE